MARKTVKVDASYNLDGLIIPQRIYWDSNHSAAVENILEIRNGISLRTNKPCVRFRIVINGKASNLYLMNDVWFVEEQEKEEAANRPAAAIRSAPGVRTGQNKGNPRRQF